MNYLKSFLEYADYMTDRAIYIWGGQTQVIRDGIVYKDDSYSKILSKDVNAWIKSVETSANNATRAIKLYNKRVAAKIDPIPCVDCSGFIMNFIQNKCHLLDTDKNANGLKGLCKQIAKRELRVGDFVFKVDKNGRATHVGAVMLNGNICESKGRDYGVIQSDISTNGWNWYGRPPFWSDADVEEVIDGDKYVFTRVLKFGVRGEDVCELKKLLQAHGFGMQLHVDNKNFLTSTTAEVKKYQKSAGLVVDGKAGPKTIKSLGGIYRKI